VYVRNTHSNDTERVNIVNDVHIFQLGISDDGRYVAGVDSLVDRDTGQRRILHGVPANSGPTAISGDGRYTLHTFWDERGTLRVWEYDLGRSNNIVPYLKSLNSVSDDGRVVGNGNRVFDLRSRAVQAMDGRCGTAVGVVQAVSRDSVVISRFRNDGRQWLFVGPLPGVQSRPYRLAAADGGVFTYGGARFFGSAATLPLVSPIVTMASTPGNRGYWLIAADGGVFTYGNARFFGSLGGIRLRSPIVGMAPTPDGRGYWLVAADGGVFAFGNARFHGSLGALNLVSPITAMAATPDGRGYWLTARDGGVFAFGNARFIGSAAGKANSPVIGVGTSPDGLGYWLGTAAGGIFAYGSAAHVGSLKQAGVTPRSPMVAFQAARDACGYRFAASDGGVFPFGGAGFSGSAGALPLQSPIVAIG
jgi:hypothetical protein